MNITLFNKLKESIEIDKDILYDDDLSKVVNTVKITIQKLFENKKEFNPVLVALLPDRQIELIDSSYAGDKNTFYSGVNKFLNEHKAEGYISIVCSFMKSYEIVKLPEEEKKLYYELEKDHTKYSLLSDLLSKYPHLCSKKDALFINIVTKTRGSFAAVSLYDLDSNRKLMFYSEESSNSYMQSHGGINWNECSGPLASLLRLPIGTG